MSRSGLVHRAVAIATGFTMMLLLIALPSAVAASAATTSKPASPRPPGLQRVQGAPRIPPGAKSLGAVASTAAVTGAVVLKPRDETALKAFIADVANRQSKNFHRYLAPGAYAARFGPTGATINAVSSSLRSAGLRVTGVASDGLLVNFSTTASRAESAFHTGLTRYRLADGTTGQATTGAVELPSSIAASVSSVAGLDQLVTAQPAYARPGVRKGSSTVSHPAAFAPAFAHPAGSPNPCPAAQQGAASQGGLTDDQIANAYGAFGLYNVGDFGAGQHIAVYELQNFFPTDIETFDTCYFGATEAAQMSGSNGNLTGSRLSVVPVDGYNLPAGLGGIDDEATLDIEDVSGIAPAANIDVYEAPNTSFGAIDEYAQIINNDTDPIVTSSWGVCEQLTQSAEPGIQQSENFLFEQAAAQGQTMFAAAGDTGNDSCNEFRDLFPPPGQNLLSVLDPASQPYVVGVGGTTIDAATQPAEERVWNDGAQWGGGGGGISESWTMPSWQQQIAPSPSNTTDVTNAQNFETATASTSAPFTTPTFCDGTLGVTAPCREVPDVSAQADEFTGAITIYGASLGYGPANGWATIGGTSSATPIWAALYALINASSSCSSDTIQFSEGAVQDAGFLSPILYGIAGSSRYVGDFNDITSGNNDDFGLDNGLVFPARLGYDMASGLGSPHLTTANGDPALAADVCAAGAPGGAAPTVSGLSPAFGSTAGGFTVTVSGTGFESGGTPIVASVQVGAAQASNVNVTGPGSLTATFPAGTATTPPGSPNPTQDGAGPAEVVVTVNNNTGDTLSSALNANSTFEYVDEVASTPVPSVTGLSPYGGLDTAPATVTVFGSDFETGGTPDVTAVHFGGVLGTGLTVLSPYELKVTPPAFSALTPGTDCPTDNGASGAPLNPAQDVCQVHVTVTTAGGTSSTSTILPPYEGPLAFDSMGGEVLPGGCGCEDMPQPDEFDYVPQPTITSVSTGTDGDLPANANALANQFGGTVIQVNGTGMDPLTFEFALLGSLPTENSIFFPLQLSGTSMILAAPAIADPFSSFPTTSPVDVQVQASSVAGRSNAGAIVYAGIPVVTGVATSPPTTPPGVSTAGGTALSLTGSGLLQTVGPIGFVDNFTGTSLGTQYNYNVSTDSLISTQSLGQNPGLVDIVPCSVTGCALNPPNDQLFVYPPGNPVVDSITPTFGLAQGGTNVTISGQNLGCVTGVFFGSTPVFQATNAQALLDCGSTTTIEAVSPPGIAGTNAPVTVTTIESDITGSGPSAINSNATFAWTSTVTPTNWFVDGASGNDANDCRSTGTACQTIGQAITDASAGDNITIEPGTYTESLTITKRLDITGVSGPSGPPVIDATFFNNGIVVEPPIGGLPQAVSGTDVWNIGVINATGEGILVDNATLVTITNNTVVDNDRGVFESNAYPPCQPNGQIPGDCGEGIHLMSVTNSTVSGNTVENNAGGILLTDETGPTAHNVISGNTVEANSEDCGITLAGHNSGAFGPTAPNPTVGGIYSNTIQGNISNSNGTTGEGAGILMAGAGPGTAVYNNLVEGNTANFNGLAGVVIHNHAPGTYTNGNQIIGNSLSGNGTTGNGGRPGDSSGPLAQSDDITVLSTGAEIAGTVISGNTVSGATYGIWTYNAPSSVSHNSIGAGVSSGIVQTGPFVLAARSKVNNALYVLDPTDYGDSAFHSLGGTITSAPAVASVPHAGAPGTPLFLAIGTNELIYVRTEAISWRALSPTMKCLSNPGVLIVGTMLYVACEGTNHNLYAAHETYSGVGLPGSISSFTNLGGGLGAGPAVALVGSTVTYFVTAGNGILYTRTATTGFVSRSQPCLGGPAAGKVDLGGAATWVACHNSSGATLVSSNNGSGWSPFASLGGGGTGVPGVAATGPIPFFATQAGSGAVYTSTSVFAWESDGGDMSGGVAATSLI